jgi:hypothetical protein
MVDVKLFQNIVSFSLCCITYINLYWYYYVDEGCLSCSLPIFLFHFYYDIFLTNKKDILLHHIFSGMLISSKYLFHMEELHYSIPLVALYQTEMSTFFYIFKLLKPYIEKPLAGPLNIFANMKDGLFLLNDILFFITFFKYRIYDYYNTVIINPLVYERFNIYTSQSIWAYLFLYGGMHGMFLLNNYWFCIICKIFFKKMIKSISEHSQIIICHRFVSYTLFINAVIGYYVYFQLSNSEMLDMIGLTILGYSSYLYHDKIVDVLLKYKTFDYTSSDVVYLFLKDMGSIHIRSFLCVASNYYYTNDSIILWYSVIFHTICFSSTCWYVLWYKWTNKKIFYDKSEKMTTFLSVTNALTVIPTTFSILSIVYNTPDIVTANGIFYATYMCGLALIIQPLYELSHCLLHVGLLVQTYFLARSNNHHP